jgi:hypothetical protein
MSTITVTRTDVSNEEVTDVLRRGLGARYHVLPATARNWNPVGDPRPDHPNSIVVGIGSTRLFRAQVRISHDSGQTQLHVGTGGLSMVPRLVNRLWITRKVLRVLRAAPSLQ